MTVRYVCAYFGCLQFAGLASCTEEYKSGFSIDCASRGNWINSDLIPAKSNIVRRTNNHWTSSLVACRFGFGSKASNWVWPGQRHAKWIHLENSTPGNSRWKNGSFIVKLNNTLRKISMYAVYFNLSLNLKRICHAVIEDKTNDKFLNSQKWTP